MGNDKEDGAFARVGSVANEKSARTGQRLVIGLALLLTLIAVIFTVWWYLIRVPETVVLTVGAGPYRSDSYELMKEVAEVVERHGKGVRLEIIATKDSSKNISLLNRGELDIATIRSDTPVVSDIRLIANLFPDFFQIIARRDAGIRNVGDLVGKRIALPPYGTDEFRSFWVVGDHYDLPIEGMDWRPMALEKAKDQLLSGKVDVIFTVRSLRDRLLLNLFEDAALKKLELNFVEIDQAEAIALKRPFIQVDKIPRGAFIGAAPTPRREIRTAVVDRVLVTRSEIDNAAISELTRVLFEHRLDLIIRFALASAILEPRSGVGLSAPLHDGAEQYFNRDQPSFLQENAEPIALVLTVLAMLFSGLLTLRKRMGNTQKDRMDTYNYMLLDIAEKARVAENKKEITELKDQMFKILETVVRALDTDDGTEEGFQSFSLVWESVREVIKDRLSELAAPA
ncbi:MAG: TAXI family TRAP transporter solute-binding subunit [Rhizobiaceae bacterium]|nr:TAXI family TRAP transporter solute-binding subunit [Rhizobiaceae bacterium]